MTNPTFTILLPVHRPPALLPYAIASVLAQERQDFELFVICDGAPPETGEEARRHAAQDPRIRVFEHPKGERHGEAYRHQALQEARGDYVCHICDDDLWLPNHLSEMAKLLDEFDFGNLAHVAVLSDGTLSLLAGNLANRDIRLKMMTSAFNFFGLTLGGYRLSAYRALPSGWSPAPSSVSTDLFMWQKFLARSEFHVGTRIVVTALKLAEPNRRGWPLEQRRAEMAAWAARLSNPGDRDLIAQMALRQLSEDAFFLRQRVDDNTARMAAMQRADKLSRKLQKMRQSWSWRLTRPFRKLARKIAR